MGYLLSLAVVPSAVEVTENVGTSYFHSPALLMQMSAALVLVCCLICGLTLLSVVGVVDGA